MKMVVLMALGLLMLVAGCTHTSVVVVTTTVVKKDLQEETEPYWPSMLPPMKDVMGADAYDELEKKDNSPQD